MKTDFVKKLQESKLLRQVIKFVFVGGTATVLDYGLFYLMINYGHINHHIANTIAFVIATFYNYTMSMKFVFVSKFDEGKRHKEFVAFFALSLVGWLLNSLGLFIFTDLMKIDPMIAKIITGVAVMAFNFISRKIYFEK